MPEKQITKIEPRKDLFLPFMRKRACAYVRVSTDSYKQLQSLQNQKDYYERMISSHPDYVFCGIYSDEGLSGAKKNRPGFRAMMEAARNGAVDVIFTKSISRFARNTILLLESVRELKHLGVAVIFEEQNINTLTAKGEFMLTVLASIAEEERKSISGNVRIALRSKFKLGDAIVHTENLLGYTTDEKGNIVIDKAQARIVRKIYRLYLSGVLPVYIAGYLNRRKIPSYTYTNAAWNYHRVRRILTNEKYVGDCCHLKYYNSDDGKAHINRGEVPMYLIRNNHIPLINRKDWDRAQEIMQRRKIVIRTYTGMLKCPYCGSSLTRHKRSDSNLVDWACGTLLRKHKAACRGVRIEESTLGRLTTGLIPLREPLVVLEVVNDQDNQNGAREKSYRLIPVSQYRRGGSEG